MTQQPPHIAHRVRRARLLDQLNINTSPIKWIQAPAGYGKTTLLSDYFSTQKENCHWFQLSEDRLDPKYIFDALSRALGNPADNPDLYALLQNFQILDLDLFTNTFIDTFLNTANTPFTIFVDDYHLLPSEHPSNNIFKLLIEKLPPNSRLLFTSRTSLPSSFTRFYVNQKIALITAQDLAFTEDESATLLQRLNRGPSLNIQEITRVCQGWAAGMIILRDRHFRSAGDKSMCSLSNDNILENYFSEEVIRNISTHDLHLLKKVSLFSQFTNSMGATLCDIPKGVFFDIIDSLYKRNFFIDKRGNEPEFFQFHPLFKSYLYSELTAQKDTFKDDNLVLILSAAKLMRENSQIEDAISLLTKFECWQELADLCIAHAPQLLNSGRHETLLSWVNPIPSTPKDANIWLSYWQCKALIPFKPKVARIKLNELFNVFSARSDFKGQILSCSAAAESYTVDADEYLSSTIWLTRLEQLLPHVQASTTPDEEGAFMEALIALTHWEPHTNLNPESLFNRALELLYQITDHSIGIRLASSLVHLSTVNGNHSKAPLILEKLRAYNKLSHISPVERVVLCFSICVAATMVCDLNTEDEERLNSALEKAKSLDMKVIEFQASIICIQGGLVYGNNEKAEKQLQALGKTLTPEKKLDNAYFHYLYGFAEAKKGNTEKARTELVRSLSFTQQLSSLAPVYPLFPLIQLEIQNHNFEIANYYISLLEKLCHQSNLDMPKLKLLFCRVYLSLENDNIETDLDSCEKAFALCKENRIFDLEGFISNCISNIYHTALQHNIESEHVVKMIQFQSIPPSLASNTSPDWPWPIRVSLMGGLHIEKNGDSVTPTKKTSSKVISLLKLLVLQSGSPQLVANITNTLWDNKDTEKAENSFKTTVLRLRKILGKSAVIVENGYVSLNKKEVWVDSWAIESVLKKTPSSYTENISRCKTLFQLYKSDFMVELNTEYWLTPYGARLNQKYAKYLENACDMAIENIDYIFAETICDELFRVNDLGDSSYYSKIKLLIAQHQNSEAISTYRSYQQQIYKRLSGRPSKKIDNLIDSIVQK